MRTKVKPATTSNQTPRRELGARLRLVSAAGLVALTSLLLTSCNKGGRTAADLAAATNYTAASAGVGTGQSYAPGQITGSNITFTIKSKDGTPIPGVTVEFKAFDITALAAANLTDTAIAPLLASNWTTANPAFYSDQSTSFCKDKSTPCSASDTADEASRATYPTQSTWVGALSAASSTSDKSGSVSVAYTTSSMFSRTMAVAMRAVSGGVSTSFVQFVRVQTSSVNDFLASNGGANGPITPTFVTVPDKILAGRQFTIILQANVPDTGTSTIDFDVSTSNVPTSAKASAAVLPSGKISCIFKGGQCIVPGGPFKVSVPGTFTISVTPPSGVAAIKPLKDFPVEVKRGPAVKLIVSSTPPDSQVTPICQSMLQLDTSASCLTISADQDKVALYPALLDEGGNFVGTAETTWSASGPLANTIVNSVGAVQNIVPQTPGNGSLTLTTSNGDRPLTASFTYLVTAGTPKTLSIASEHTIGTTAVEVATQPFKALVQLFDAKNNLCTNYTGQVQLSFAMANANNSVPPVGSGWAPSVPVTSFTEAVNFKAGVGTTLGAYVLAYVPAAGETLPTISVTGSISAAPATSAAIAVQPGPTSQTLLRTAPANGGAVWTQATTIRSDQSYYFTLAGYDAAGNYTADVFAKFYGVQDGFNVVTGTPGLIGVNPASYATAGACPSPPAAQPAPIVCPVHRSITLYSGSSTVFTVAGDTGIGRVLAIPQKFDASGGLAIPAALSPSLSISSGLATSMTLQILDNVSGNPVVTDATTGVPTLNAGQIFNIRIQALDAKGLAAAAYAGPKTINFLANSNPTWGGTAATVPNGAIACTFTLGTCTVPGNFVVYDTQTSTAISVQDISPAPANPIPRVWSALINVLPGAEAYTMVVNRTGGPTAGAAPWLQVNNVTLRLTADQEYPFAAAVTDAYGNWIRDMATNEAIWDGTASITTPAVVPNSSNSWTSSDIFAALNGAGQSNVLKFLPPASASVINAANKDTTKYDVVYQPADRVGSGWILVKSATHTNLMAQLSPPVVVTPGVIEHVEIVDKDDLNNLNQVPSACFNVRIRIHDKKHNQLTDYTANSRVALKWFKPGTVDAHPGDFTYLDSLIAANGHAGSTNYAAGNASAFPTYNRAGFLFADGLGSTQPAVGGTVVLPFWNDYFPVHAQATDSQGTYYQDWWINTIAIIAGEFSLPGKACLWDARQDASTNYAIRELQVELPALSGSYSQPALVSRGAATLASAATPHAQPDSFKTLLGGKDHFHFTTADSVAAPNWLPRDLPHGTPWIVETPCPLPAMTPQNSILGTGNNWGFCGPQTFYIHMHDSGCNYLGPASRTAAAISSALPSSEVTTAAAGALGSASFTIAPHALQGSYPAAGIGLSFSNTDSALFPSVTLSGQGPGGISSFKIQPGAPISLALNLKLTGSTSVIAGIPFGIEAKLLDQYGNTTGGDGTGSSYYSARKRHLSFTWDAGSSPKNHAPVLGPAYDLGSSSTTFYGDFVTSLTDFTTYSANTPINLTGTMQDINGRPACNIGAGQPCPPALQTFTNTITFTPDASTPVEVDILDAPNLAGQSIPANASGTFQLTAGASAVLSACTKDSEGNISTCTIPSAVWTDLNDTPTGATQSVLTFNASQPNISTFTGPTLTAYAMATGSAKVGVSITNPITATAQTGTIVVPAGVPQSFRLDLPATPIVAGTPFTVTITALDNKGNLASAFSGAKTVNITSLNDVGSTGLGCYNNAASFPHGASPITFTNGVATFSSTLFVAGNNGFSYNVNYPGGGDTYNGLNVFGSSATITAAPAPLSTYVASLSHTASDSAGRHAEAKSSPDDDYADAGGSRFDAKIQGIDAWGNFIDMSQAGQSQNITVAIYDTTGAQTTGALTCQDHTTACLSGLSVHSLAGTSLPKLAFDHGVGIGAMMYVTDGVHHSRTGIGACENTFVQFRTSRLTVAQYTVAPVVPTAVAGTPFNVIVTAVDNSGAAILSADSDLSAMTLNWKDETNAAIPSSPAPSSSAPSLPTTLTFTNGVAIVPVTLYKAPQTLALKLSDNQSVAKSGTSPSLSVTPSAAYKYNLTASTYPGGVAIADGTTLNADCSSSGVFTLTVNATDGYSNPKTGESDLYLRGVRQSGTLIAAALHGTNLPGGGSNGSPYAYSSLTMTSSQATFAGICYLVPQQVKLTLGNTTGTITHEPLLNFQKTIDTIYRYDLNLSSYSFAAGTPVTATITARDWGNNPVTGLDTDLNNQTYTWTGPGVSPAPTSLGLTLGTANAPAGLFTNGVATTTLYFHKAESLPDSTLRVIDDRTQSYNDYSPRRGSAGSITVTNDLPSKYVLTAPSVTALAPDVGVPFGVTLQVTDNYDNPSTAWTTDTLSWSWTNAASSVANPKTGTVYNPTLPSNGATTFTAATVNAGNVTLYRTTASHTTATLTVTGTNSGASVTKSGSPLSAALNLTPNANAATAYTYLTDSASCTGNGDCGSGSTRQNIPISLATSNTKAFYTHAFDLYGNYKGIPTAAAYSLSNATPGTLSAATGGNTTFTANGSGTTTLSTSCSNVSAGCLGDATGLMTVTSGGLVFVVTHANPINAGTQMTVTVTAKDSLGNTASDFTGAHSVVITLLNDTPSPEGVYSSYPTGSQTLTFTAGVATFNATLYNAGNNTQFQVTQSTPVGILGVGPMITVNPLTLDHYATHANSTINNNVPAKSTLDSVAADTASANGLMGSRFQMAILARDIYGNNVNLSGANSRTLTISMKKADGTTASTLPLKCSDNTQSCLSNVTDNSSSGGFWISNLAYDLPGVHYLWVVDQDGKTVSTTNSATVTFTASRYTVKNYSVTIPSTATAGAAFIANIAALDNSGANVVGADSDLSAQSFSWTDGSGVTIPSSPSPTSQAPVLPATLSFVGGAAAPQLTLYNAPQTLSVQLKDNQSTVRFGTSASTVTVSAATGYKYRIYAFTYPGGVPIADNTMIAADASPSGAFNITVDAYDPYDNVKAGEAGVGLIPVRMSGSLTAGLVRNSGRTELGLVGGPLLSLASGTDTLTNVYYTTGQNIQFALSGSTGTVAVTPTLSFQNTIHSVDHYALSLATSTPTAGATDAATIIAHDYAHNTITGIDAALNAQNYTWSGPGVSPAPTSAGLALGAAAAPKGLFSSGVATTTLTFNKAETLASGVLSMSDDHSQSYLGSRSSVMSGSSIVVSPGAANSYVIASSSVSPGVGQAFSLTLSALDAKSNLVTGWNSDTLAWSWSGASSSISNPKTASTYAPTAPSNGSTTFNTGVASLGNFYLYRSGETPTLTVTGTKSGANTVSGTALTTTLNFTPQIDSGWGYVYVTDGSICSGTGDCGVGSTRQNGTAALSIGSSKIYYSHGFDLYGNYKGLANTSWSSSGTATVTLTPASGASSSTLAPSTSGSAVISSNCTALTAACVGDSSGTVTISVGSRYFAISHPSSVTAGTPFTVTVRAKDANNNVDTTYTGSQAVTINAQNNAGNAEGWSATYPSGNQNLTFTAGVATFSATAYNASNTSLYFQVSQSTPQSIFGTGGAITTITPLTLHHYSTVASRTGASLSVPAKSTLDSNYADTQTSGVYGSRFNTRIYGRDQYGNNLDFSASNKTLTLSLRKSDGATTSALPLKCSDNTQTCLSNVTLSSANGYVDIPGLAYDVGGAHYVWAIDGASVGTATGSSSLIQFATSRYTVNHYNVTAPTNATAGTAFVTTVAAIDNAGLAITGADTDLALLTFTWADGSAAALSTAHIAPDGTTAPVMVTTSLPFGSGSASLSSTLYKAETLALNVTDNQTVPKTGTSSNLTVAYSSTLKYGIVSSLGTTVTGIAADPSGAFNLTITAYDPYLNPRPGESSAVLKTVRSSGATTIYNLEGTGLSVSNGGVVFNALSGSATITGAYYRVAQTVTFGLASSSGSVLTTPTHTFVSTVHSVASYGVTHAATATAGTNNLTVTLTARDPAGNTVNLAAVDTALTAQTFTWTGMHSSPSPTNQAASYPTTGYSFSGGVANVTFGLFAAETISLTATDNHSFSGITSRTGTSASAVAISNKIISKYAVTASSTSPQAGNAFNVTVTAQDQYSNPATDWTSDTLTYAWTVGGSPSVTNPKTAGVQSVSVLGSSSRTFTNGVYASTGTPFVLYRSGEATTLTVTGTNTATASSSALSATLNFTPVANSSTGYILMTDAVTCTSGLGSSCSGSNVLNAATFNMTTDIAKNLYAHGFDAYGNYKALTSVTWTGTNELASKFTPSTGSQTSLAATAVTAAGATATADCSALSGCISATTGTINVSYGSISKLVFLNSAFSGATTDTCSTVTAQVQDNSNNPVSLAAGIAVTFSNLSSTPATNDGVFYSDNACTSALASSQANIATGQNQVTVYFKKPSVATATSIKVAYSTFSATQNTSIAIGVLKKIAFTTSALTQTASTGCGTVTFNVTDNSGNVGTLPASPTVFTMSTSTSSSAGVFYSDAGCSSALASSQQSLSSASGGTVYYKDTHAGTPTLTITATLAGGAATISQAGQTINPGAFDFATPASGTSVKDTQSITWTASAGAKDYVVTYGSTSCSSSATVTAPTVTWSIPTTQNVSNFRVCITARGWDSSLPTLTATSNASYTLLIDNTIPTQTITVPGSGITMIGPVTTATGASSGTTTLAGTAADPTTPATPSGVSTVQVSLMNNSNSNYWNGSSWAAGVTWNTATGTTSWTYPIANANFTNGTVYTLAVKTTDGSGNVSTTTTINNITWNSTAPIATQTGAPVTYTKSNALSVTVAGTSVLTYQSGLNSAANCTGVSYGSATAIATLITTALASDGQYTLCIKGIDQAGNVQSTPTAITFTRDTVAPSVSVGSPSTVLTNGSYDLSHALTTNPSASDAVSGTPTVAWTKSVTSGSCAVSTLSFSSTTSLTPTITMSGCASATTFSLTLTATDGATNTATSVLTFTYDPAAPTVSSITSTAGHKTTGNTVSITVNFNKTVTVTGTPLLALNTTPAQSASYSSGSGSSALVFTYTVQAGDNTVASPSLYATNPEVSLNITSSTALSLNGGTIVDTVGLNLGATNTKTPNSASLTGLPTSGATALTNTAVVIDTYAPTSTTAPFVAGTLPGSQSNALTPSLQVQSADAASFNWCVVAGSSCPAIGSCTTSVTYGGTPQSFTLSSISGLADGSVTTCSYATDRAGNVQATPTSYTWTKDTVAPVAFTVNGPSSPTYSATPTVTWTAPAGDVQTITLKIGTNNTCTSPSQTYSSIAGGATSQVLTTLTDGTYYACMTAADVAGNTTTITAYSFEVETDTVHLAYTIFDGANTYAIKYGKWASGTWTTESVKSVSSGSLDARTSLALDSSNQPYISYRYVNGTATTLYANGRTPTWGSDITVLSNASAAVGKFPALALDSSNLFWLSMQNTISSKDSIYLTQWDNSPACYTSCTPTTSGQNRDTSIAAAAYTNDTTLAIASSTGSDVAHYVYSYYNGTNWQLRYRQSTGGSTSYESVPLDATCTDAKYAQVFVKPTGTANQDKIAMVYACVTNNANTPCKVFYTERTSTNLATGANGALGTSVSWLTAVTVGTMRATCSVANLTDAMRPSLTIDRQNASRYAHVAWYDYDNNKIKSSSNEASGTWNAEDAVTGLTAGAGYPSIGVDTTGRSYITYYNNSGAYMVNNNARAGAATSGSWSAASTISASQVIGVSSAGISGMLGRSYNGTGK